MLLLLSGTCIVKKTNSCATNRNCCRSRSTTWSLQMRRRDQLAILREAGCVRPPRSAPHLLDSLLVHAAAGWPAELLGARGCTPSRSHSRPTPPDPFAVSAPPPPATEHSAAASGVLEPCQRGSLPLL